MAITVRKGYESQFDINKMLPGEFAVVTDTNRVFVCTSAGGFKELASVEDVPAEIRKYLEENEIEGGATEEEAQQIKKNTEDIKKLSQNYGEIEEKVETNESKIQENSLEIIENSKQLKTKANAIITEKSGSAIVATDSTSEKPEGFKVYGKTEQKTIPGNQLLRYPYSGVSNTNRGVTTTVNDDGSVSFSGTNESSDDVYFSLYPNVAGKRLNLKAGTYTLSVPNSTKIMCGGIVVDSEGNNQLSGSIDLTNTVRQRTFTMDRDGELFLHCFIKPGVTVNETIYPMLNAGSTALPWEPYVGGMASPNPEYQQDIASCEKTEVGVYGGNLASNIYCSEDASPYTKILYAHADLKPSTIYTISFVGAKGNNFYLNESVFSEFQSLECTGERQFITAKTNDVLNKTVSSYDNARGWILFKNSSANTVVPRFTDVQIELGSTATPYKPYTKQSLTIPYTLCGISVTDASLANYTDENGQMWACDEVDYKRGVIVKRIGKEMFNTLSMGMESADITGRFLRAGALKNRYLTGMSPVISNKFYFSGWGSPIDNKWVTCLTGSLIYVAPPKGSGYTLETLNAYLAEKITADNPLIIIGILETPTETPLSAEELEAYKALTMNYPTTTILNNNGAGMKVSYVADTQNHIKHNYVPVSEFNALVKRVIALEKNAV